MKQPYYPSLYQLNSRVWLTDISCKLGRQATLDDIPEVALAQFAKLGFDWIWLLSVWTTGEKGRQVSLENREWRHEFEDTLPDLQEQDIGGSGFAIADYHVHPKMGGDAALRRLRSRLQRHGLKLMLDFVPNHMGPDHAWVQDHPEYFVTATEDDLARHPQNYKRVKIKRGELIFAYGRDPYFDGWPDTLQLDYSNPATVEGMANELLRISGQCDGVRCDMAMLILPEIFERTWGRRAQPYWPIVTKTVREQVPGFCFMAEVYWDLEWALQQQGFDYTYDKRLYDRLREGDARSAREHLHAALDFQQRSVRFLENHDEPRAAVTFDPPVHEAAAIVSFTIPGLRFFHQGQFEGRKKRISPHLVRGPKEVPDNDVEEFYNRLLGLLQLPVFKAGQWQWLDCVPAWDGNNSWDAYIAHCWQGPAGERVVIAVNYALHQSQCYLKLPIEALGTGKWRLQDLMSEAVYEREVNDLQRAGLYLDMKPWQYHIFEMQKLPIQQDNGLSAT